MGSLKKLFLILFLGSGLLSAQGGVPPEWQKNGLEQSRFESLAVELAPKVNLFRELWNQAPDAEFTGGTVRDYLYWLRSKLYAADDAQKLAEVIAALRATSSIDVREFVHEESDIDYTSPAKSFVHLNVADFGVKKMDAVGSERFVPGSSAYESEILQGFIPIEKMLLSRTHLKTAPGFGNGVSELFSGSPSVSLPNLEDFNRSHYAAMGSNHRILLVMRYLRTLSLNYAKTGHALSDYPEMLALLEKIDSKTQKQISLIVESAAKKNELGVYFKNRSFAK